MGNTFRSIVVIVAVGVVVLAFGTVFANQSPVDAGLQAAKAWLAVVDRGDYGRAWDEASRNLQNDLARPEWQRIMREGREAVGELVQRKLQDKRFTRSIAGAPAGSYVVIEYRTDFRKKSGVVEKITVTRETDGAWRVSAYIFGY